MMTLRLGDLVIVTPYETSHAYAFDLNGATGGLIRVTADEKLRGIIVDMPTHGINGGEIVVMASDGRRLSFHPNDLRVTSRVD